MVLSYLAETVLLQSQKKKIWSINFLFELYMCTLTYKNNQNQNGQKKKKKKVAEIHLVSKGKQKWYQPVKNKT